MVGPTETTQIAHWLLDGLTDTVTNYANAKSQLMIGMIGPLAACLLAMYVLLWGAGIASGQITEPFTDGAKRICRMSAIIAFALTVSIYQGSVATFFETVPASMATQLMSDGSASTGTAASIADVLDTSLGKGLHIGETVWEEGDKTAAAGSKWSISSSVAAIPYYMLAIGIDVACVLIVGVGAAILFVAYIATALLLAIGPIFILLAIFPRTQRFFETWLGQVVSFAMLYLLIAVTIGMTFTLFEKFIADLPVGTIGDIVISAIKVIGAVIAIVTVMLQTRAMAASLGGGLALQAQGLAGKLAGGAAGAGRMAMTGSSDTPAFRKLSQALTPGTKADKTASKVVMKARARVRRAFSSTNSASEGK